MIGCESAAYWAGHHAWHCLVPEDANPYDPDTTEHDDWAIGWSCAEAENLE